MKTTVRGYFIMTVVAGLALFAPGLRAELTAEQRRQAQESAAAIAAGRVVEADKLQPAEAALADRARWLELRGRWLLRDEKYADAEKDFLAAKKLIPGSVPVAAGLAEVALRLGHKEEAMALINAVAEQRKAEDPAADFGGREPGVPSIFLLLQEWRGTVVDEETINEFETNGGEALPDAYWLAGRYAEKQGELVIANDFCTRAIKAAGGKFPAAERMRLAQATALERTSPELGQLRFDAETQLARGNATDARKLAQETLKTRKNVPTFAARQLLFARAVAAEVLLAEPGPLKVSEVNQETLEAIRIFATVPYADEAAATAAAAALHARLETIDPVWLAGIFPKTLAMADEPASAPFWERAEKDTVADSELRSMLQPLAEAQLARGEAGEALQTAKTILKSGRELPTFAARQLLFARAATAVLLQAQPGPMKSSDVDADTLEATHIFASVPELDAAAVLAETALLARLKKIDPLWPADTLAAPMKLKADSSIMQLLAAEPLRSGSYRVVALEKAFVAEWGNGPTAVELETAEGRVRWGMISRVGAFVAHLRWLTLPAGSKEAVTARVDERKRTILALLCVPEDTAALLGAKQHAWFKGLRGPDGVAGNRETFTGFLKKIYDGDTDKRVAPAPADNREELGVLLTEVMPLAEGGPINLRKDYPGIATAVAVRVTEVMGRLRMKRQDSIAVELERFVWDWTKDPARVMDVNDWGYVQEDTTKGQVYYYFDWVDGFKNLPLVQHLAELDRWVWEGADPKKEPVTPAQWAKVPSVLWRHALGSCGSRGNFKRLTLAKRSGAWGLSLSISSSVGQAIQLLNNRLGVGLAAPMNGQAGAEWLISMLEIEEMLKEPDVSPEVRTRLSAQLNLHRAQVLIASGQRELANKELPALVAQLEAPPPVRQTDGANLVSFNLEEYKAQVRSAQLAHDEAERKRGASEPVPYVTQRILRTIKCIRCDGTGVHRDPDGHKGTQTYLRLDGTRRTYEKSYDATMMECERCKGTGQVQYEELK